jgi:hypothetical protein
MADEDRKPEPEAQTADLEEVRRVFGPVEADLIKSFLESQGVKCLVRGRMAPFIYPFTVDGLAEFKILVNKSDAARARELLAQVKDERAEDEGPGPEDK